MKVVISEKALGSLITNGIKKQINEAYKVRNWERNLMKDYPYIFKNGQNLYYVRLDKDNRVEAAWRTDLDGGNREYVNAPQVQALIDQKNIKLTKRNTGGTNATNIQTNTNTSNTPTNTKAAQETQQNNSGYYNPNQTKKATNKTAPASQEQNQKTGGPEGQSPEGQEILPDSMKEGAVNAWNRVGIRGQIKLIQETLGLTGTDADGRVGPQTTGRIAVALLENATYKAKMEQLISSRPEYKGINAEGLKSAVFNYGKQATYNKVTNA